MIQQYFIRYRLLWYFIAAGETALDMVDSTEVDSAVGFNSRTLLVLKSKTSPETRLSNEELQVRNQRLFTSFFYTIYILIRLEEGCVKLLRVHVHVLFIWNIQNGSRKRVTEPKGWHAETSKLSGRISSTCKANQKHMNMEDDTPWLLEWCKIIIIMGHQVYLQEYLIPPV